VGENSPEQAKHPTVDGRSSASAEACAGIR
jgi:hypothetical protein